MTRAKRILQMLQTAPDNTLTNAQLNSICYRYGARIHDLRSAGHNITSKCISKGLWQFTLEGAGQ